MSRLSCIGLCLMATVCVAEDVGISVRLVKVAAGRCVAAPQLHFVGADSSWRLVEKPWHHGENDWEVYFEVSGTAVPQEFPAVVLTVPGVRAARVLVGKTDVPFRQDGDTVHFTLVNDRSRGLLMQVTYRDPRGGYPIEFIHNWEMRRSWQYLENPYPARQVAAVKNTLLAVHEVLRLMGDMGPGQPKTFAGDIVLMDSEVAATRGHMDYPPHVHVMFYQFEKDAQGQTQWVGRLVPHFYMDAEARIVRNSYAVLAGPGKSAEIGVGGVCRFEDTHGQHVLDLVITAKGLDLRRPDGVVYSVRPDPERGADHAVWGYRGDEALFRVAASDDPEKGVFGFRIETLKDGVVSDTFADGYRYDPFTAKVLGRLQPGQP